MAIRRVWIGTIGPFLYDDEEHDYAIRTDGELPGGATELGELTDVVLTNPHPGQALVFDGTNWVNQFVSLQPAAPEDFDAVVDGTTAQCSWSAVPEVDGYNVYLKSNGEFVKQNSELVTETVYDIENLEDGDYEAYATSVLNEVESGPSNTKAFEIIPVSGDLFTDFSEYTEDEFPSDWVNINNASNWVVTSGILTSGLTSDNDRANWDVGEGALSDIEVLAKMRTSNNASTNRLRVFARSNMGEGFTTAGVDTYYAGLRAGTRVEIAKLVNGSFSQVASNLSFSYLANTWYWMRFRLEGTSLKVKVWADGETEPEAWTVETTDSSHSSGYVGFGGAAHKHEFDSLNIEDISA